MYDWVKKIHMYSELLTFTALTVWGITGIHAVFLPAPGGYAPPEVSSAREVPYYAPGNLDDAALAKQIYQAIEIPLAGGHYNIRRDDDLNLAFFVFTYNGRRDVTFLEEKSVVQIAHRKNPISGFLSSMHASHTRRGPKALPARMWAFYNEFSLWAFTFMTFSGVYLWAATRPGLRWAQLTFGLMMAISIVLWMATR